MHTFPEPLAIGVAHILSYIYDFLSFFVTHGHTQDGTLEK